MSRIDHLMTREIPQPDRDLLHRACGLRPSETLTDQTKRCYWEYKIAFDRIDAGAIPPATIALIAMLSGRVKSLPKDQEIDTVAKAWKEKRAKHGDPITVIWRGRSSAAELHDVSPDGKRIMAIVNSDGVIREFSPSQVWLGTEPTTTADANLPSQPAVNPEAEPIEV